jgi:hypothetical protein
LLLEHTVLQAPDQQGASAGGACFVVEVAEHLAHRISPHHQLGADLAATAAAGHHSHDPLFLEREPNALTGGSDISK